MHLVHNEQTKLTASIVNTAAGAVIAVGVIAPVIAFSFGFANAQTSTAAWFIILLSFVWLLTGAGLHLLARIILKGLRE